MKEHSHQPNYPVQPYQKDALARDFKGNFNSSVKIAPDIFANFDDDGVRETVQRAMQNFLDLKITRDEVQDKMGIHWRTLQQIRFGKSKKLMTKTVQALEEFNSRCERNQIRKEKRGLLTRFIETENVQRIRLTIHDCLKNYQRGLYIVLGPLGCGKTCALNYVMDEMARDGEFGDWRIIKVHVHEWHTCKTLLIEIANQLGMDTSKNCSAPKLISRLTKEFYARKTAVFFDEADWLMNRRKLNLLRSMWDIEHFACYLIGVAEIIENFYRNYARNMQIMGRIFTFVRISNMKMKDIVKFFDNINIEPEALDRIYELTGGNAHLIGKTLYKIELFKKGGRAITEGAAEEIYKTLMFSGQF